MKPNSVNHVVFDIGSNKISAIAAHIDKKGKPTIISQVLQQSQGFRAGKIVNLELAENSIISAIYSLEQECDKNISKVMISLSSGVKSYYTNHTIKLGNQVITKQDIKKLMQKALSEFSINDQEIIHYFPVEFVLDENNTVENPIGMYAKELSCQLHIITANSLMLKNLANCFAKCHIEVTDVISSIYADGLVCLTEDEKETGGIIIDIGSHVTNFGIFFEGKILYVGEVLIGGHHITFDIAKNLSLSMHIAEKLKILYGNARLEFFNKNEAIRISDFEPDINSDLTISASELAEIVHSRVKEILLLLKKEYDYISMDHLIAKRIILTGGCSALQGVKNLTAEIFQKKVRLAQLENAPEFIDNVNTAIYSTAMGMIKSKILKYKKNSFKASDQEGHGWFKKIFSWLKENI